MDTADHMGKEPRHQLFTEIRDVPCPRDTARHRLLRKRGKSGAASYDIVPEQDSASVILLYGGQEVVKESIHKKMCCANVPSILFLLIFFSFLS